MSNLNSNLDALFGKMENFVSTKTVVGEAVTFGDITVIPFVDVSFGVGAGSTSSNQEKDNKESGMGGLGAKITPSAVMVVQNGNVQMVSVKNQSAVEKLINMAPGIASKLNFSFGSKKKDSEETKEEVKFEEERITE